MPRIEKQIVVQSPPEKVYDYLADLGRHGEWAGDKLQIHQTSEGPVAVGTTFESNSSQMGKHNAIVTVTDLVPNQRIGYEANDNTGHWRHEIDLEPADGGTRITKRVVRLSAPPMERIMG